MNSYKMFLGLSTLLFVFLFKVASSFSVNSVTYQRGTIVFSCVSGTIPMWVMQSGSDPTLRGIAVGERKQSTFPDQRFVVSQNKRLDSWLKFYHIMKGHPT